MFELSHHALLWAQALGFISMAVGWWANSQKNDRQLLSGNLIASSITAIHLGLLGSSLGMFNQLLNAVRFATCQKRSRRGFLPILFSTVAIMQGLIFAEHWSEWCAVTSAVLISFALFYSSGAKLRSAMVISNLLNLTLSVYLCSWSGILYQVVTLLILTRSLMPHKQAKCFDEQTA
ncbi:YgjV family protein [Shewanella schlegeliana]|uniref:YgjV family protein n=1 Tax=Shewanella schlegeliana TaxID=190308 RepID=A0ABS1SYG2_9GAMM|nr:YgjV family protein [Shewanella schlegeliana]MBL4913567.1 YgjV family protein [Shewanella schlegeliana]MCL1108458.1 YgjV family protein [Shewanella schlegeliana]